MRLELVRQRDQLRQQNVELRDSRRALLTMMEDFEHEGAQKAGAWSSPPF